MIDLYTAPTPEGWKVSIALEELRIPYVVHAVDACGGKRAVSDLSSVNPCACVPAIIDHDENGRAVSGASEILVYLADKTGQLMPRDASGRALAAYWLALNLDEIDARAGARNAKSASAGAGVAGSAGASRSQLRRLFDTLDAQLQRTDYLAGSFSIADIAQWAWVRMHAWSGIDMSGYRALAGWMDRVAARDACRRGIAVPRPFEPAQQVKLVKSILVR